MIKFIQEILKKRKINKQKKIDFINSKKEYSFQEYLFALLEININSYNHLPVKEKIEIKERIIGFRQGAIKILICPICMENLKIHKEYKRKCLGNDQYRTVVDYKKYYCSSKECDYCYIQR